MHLRLLHTFLAVRVAGQAHHPSSLHLIAPWARLQHAPPVFGRLEHRQIEDNIDVILTLRQILIHCKQASSHAQALTADFEDM